MFGVLVTSASRSSGETVMRTGTSGVGVGVGRCRDRVRLGFGLESGLGLEGVEQGFDLDEGSG